LRSKTVLDDAETPGNSIQFPFDPVRGALDRAHTGQNEMPMIGFVRRCPFVQRQNIHSIP
jgi:hypothetical protein